MSPPRLSARGKPKGRRSGKVWVRGKRKTNPDLWALDTITFVAEGLWRSIVCLVSERWRVALAFATSHLSSRQTGQFLRAFVHTFYPPAADTDTPPRPLPCFVTDNGSEFEGEFEKALQSFGLEHLWTHPRSPKENPFVERGKRPPRDVCQLPHGYAVYRP